LLLLGSTWSIDPDGSVIYFLRAEYLEKCAKIIEFMGLKYWNIVKEDSGLVRGYVKEVNIVPRNSTLFTKSKKEFAELGQKIHLRRNKLTFQNLDDFAADSKEIAHPGWQDNYQGCR
jgi:hypothetical protein